MLAAAAELADGFSPVQVAALLSSDGTSLKGLYHELRRGEAALLAALEEIGVKQRGHRKAIANAMRDGPAIQQEAQRLIPTSNHI